ncbi:hypothetical protein I4U23_017988 [Adineta vaga]|nr:hypothetical protein I4U23_017988 [Adineta vaga]
MNLTNVTSFFHDESSLSNPCPRQRHITRPLLFVHNYSLFFFGSIFNFLAFIILMQRSLRCHSTFAYLAFLSLSNGLLSLVHFSKWMLKYYFNFLSEHVLFTCRFHRFFSDFLTHFSLFTLICVNIDRARTVTKTRPNQKHPKSKFRLVLIKELLAASLLCAFHFHWIIKYGYEYSIGEKTFAECGFNENQGLTIYYYLLTIIYPPFELAFFFCLPLLINIFCTILIVRSLSIRMRTAQQFHSIHKENSQKKSHNILSYFLPKTTSHTNVHSCLCFKMQCRRHTRLRLKIGRSTRSLVKYQKENQKIQQEKSLIISTHISQDNQSQNISRIKPTILTKKHRTRRSRDIHLSAMLIGLNILYLILNLPFNLHQTFAKYFYRPHSDQCGILFTSLLLDALQQTFFSTNFFLYVLTNRRFREEFYITIMKILSHCKRKPSQKISKRSQTKARSRISSLNLSTIISTNQIGDNQMTSVLTNPNRDSLLSDLEITIMSPNQRQTLQSLDETNSNK